MSRDVRPFFGEESETLGDSRHPWQPDTHDRGGNVEARWQRRIQAGTCPRVACQTELDDGFCPRCGWSLLDEQMRRRLEQKEQKLPELPAELTVDCFAPADLTLEEIA